jgi:hypothetical protein
MTTISQRLQIAACTLALCGSFLSTDVYAEPGSETWKRQALEPSQKISPDAKTWSLFLICNPAWIAKNGDKGITDLFLKFEALGRTIGPNNLAIWFKEAESTNPTTVGDTDIERSCTYYKRYKLQQDGGPYILVTTIYPDDDDQPQGRSLAVNLDGLNADDSARKLSQLKELFDETGLKQGDPFTDTWWDKVVSSTLNFFCKVTFSVNLVALKINLESKKRCND